MFDKEYEFRGKHASYVLQLVNNPHADFDSKKGVFQRNVDVYMVAPLVGVLYNRKASVISATPTTKIFSDVMNDSRDELKFILTTVLLNDRDIQNEDDRIESAFRSIYSDEKSNDLLIKFNQYVLGGVEILYERIIENTKNYDEMISNFNTFNEEFNQRFFSADNDHVYSNTEVEVKI